MILRDDAFYFENTYRASKMNWKQCRTVHIGTTDIVTSIAFLGVKSGKINLRSWRDGYLVTTKS